MVDRKRELKKWLIDHPEINSVVLGRAYGCTKQAAHKLLLLHRAYARQCTPCPFWL